MELKKKHIIRVRVELAFNGNCAEAIALYERAFGVKAEGILRYKEAPPEDGSQHPKGTEDFVMHTRLILDDDAISIIGMHDRTPNRKCCYGDGVAVTLGFNNADAVRAAFDVLKESGGVGVEPKTVFFSECYCEVKDKFGVSWIMSYN